MKKLFATAYEENAVLVATKKSSITAKKSLLISLIPPKIFPVTSF